MPDVHIPEAAMKAVQLYAEVGNISIEDALVDIIAFATRDLTPDLLQSIFAAHPPAVDARQRRFLQALETSGTVTRALEVAGLTATTVYRWADKDPLFNAAFTTIKEQVARKQRVTRMGRLGLVRDKRL